MNDHGISANWRYCNEADITQMPPIVTRRTFRGLRVPDRHVVLCEYAIAPYCRICSIFQQCACRIFFCKNWHLRRQFWYNLCFYYLFLLGFVTSTIWLPTERHHPCVRTPVERDGVVGFKQFCTIFPLHIWRLCHLHTLNKNAEAI